VTPSPVFLLPYEFSPAVLLLCSGALFLYLRGLYRHPGRTGRARPLAFLAGIALIYLVMQTRYDYWSQHMFFVHRLQHLVLHHAGPFLIALSFPGAVLARGAPAPLRRAAAAAWSWPPLRRSYVFIQHPVIAGLLFVGLIYLWLIPEIHFYAMLDHRLYALMNWSMAVDGLLFWWLILHGRPGLPASSRSYAWRILLLFLIALPQIVIGAWIALSGRSLYDIYAVCGRIWPISPAVDQQLGGLITWIPAAMMSLFGMLAVLHQWLQSEKRRHPEYDRDNERHALPTS
jgi:putative membrane protein